MTTPILTQAEARTHQTFEALMWSLSYPGTVRQWSTDEATTLDGLTAIGQSLMDLETSFFTEDARLRGALTRTSARAVSAETARFHFYPVLNRLTAVSEASVGDMLYPDRSATLVIGCALGSGQTLTLTGPGIKTQATIAVGEISAEFWQLRRERNSYPLGWDIFLVDGNRVLGLPRTTQISPGGTA